MSEQKGGNKLAMIKSFVTASPHEMDLTTAKGFVQDLLYRVKNVDMGGMGAQLAYFFLLSFFPLIIFLVTLLPYLNLKQEQIFEFMENIIPGEVYSMVEGILLEVLSGQNGGLLSIGILGTIWSASKGVDALMKGLNRAYHVKGRPGFKNRLWSLIFTISLVGVILIALVFPVFGQQIGNIVASYLGIEAGLGPVWTFIRWATPPLLILTVLWTMYWIVPNTDPRIKFFHAWPGAILATLGWLGLTYGFSFYINNFGNFSATYGSIGGVIILMLWLYFTGMILIFGGLVNASLAQRKLALLRASNRKTVKF